MVQVLAYFAHARLLCARIKTAKIASMQIFEDVNFLSQTCIQSHLKMEGI